ncbi:MAG: exonuclease domain-containing protein [Candidatus Gracilibacteria bacterium]
MDRTFVALDIETTGFDAEKDQVIEIAAIKFDDNKVIDTFDTLVHPNRNVPPIIIHMTGISDEMLEGAPQFEDIKEKLVQFIGKHPIVGHNISFDVGFLNQKGCALTNPLFDTLDLASMLIPGLPSYSLDTLTRSLKIKHENKHRALSDTQATQELFSIVLQKIKELDEHTLEGIKKVLDKSTWPMRDLFLYEDGQKSKPDTSMYEEESIKPKPFPPTQYDTFFNENGALSKVIQDYECRDTQKQASNKILECFQLQKHLLLEAGTGTGKTLAYLAAAVYFAQLEKKKVVISTHTKNLQDQIINKDIPLLRKALKSINEDIDFKATLLKGRSNYVSVKRLHRFMNKDMFEDHEVTFLLKVMMWLQWTTTGDISELSIQGKEFPLRFEVCYEDGSDDENDPNYVQQSFLKKARRNAEESDIIVVNHALLLTDAVKETPILPEYDFVVFDEAHHLENVTTDSLTINFSPGSFSRPFEKIARIDEDLSVKCRQIESKADLFFGILGIFTEKHADAMQLQYQYLIQGEALNSLEWKKVQDSVKHLDQLIQELIEDLKDYSNKDEDTEREVRAQAFEIRQRHDDLKTVFLNGNWDNRVQWTYKTYDGTSCLKSAPINVGVELHNFIFNAKKSAILTSATLQTEQNFDFIRHQLALDSSVEAIALPSHFDYPDQVKIIIPEDMPAPKTEGYFKACNNVIEQVVKANGGRTLVLFTSKKALTASYMALAPDLKTEGYNVLAQGVTGGKGKILEHFKEEPETSVLFGTASFWQGIDIPGDLLTCVIMQKLPFDPPSDPLIYSRGLQYQNAFSEYQLPLAILRFKQGFGRLIRTSKDKGCMIILDSRILQNSYGQKFLTSLPEGIRLDYSLADEIGETLNH